MSEPVDVAAIKANHHNGMLSHRHPICEKCAEPWPCDTYRLAEFAEQAREDADEYAPILDRCSELLRGVANALNGPPPPLTTWSHHDLPEKAQSAVDALERAQAAGEGADILVAQAERRGAERGWDEGNRYESEYLMTYGQFCSNPPNPYRSAVKNGSADL